MAISNKEIADYLRKYADVMEIYAENPYRIRAYRRAARTIIRLEQNIYDLIQKNYALTNIPNIGPAIANQIHQIIKTNKPLILKRNQVKEKPFRNELLQVKGLGKKRIALLKLQGIVTIKSLLEALQNGTLRSSLMMCFI
ncbi:MAG: hypothetical protein JO149_04990 [Gammaproteobacteria bacterium]|nr:hypothetical protein [Gammaproteobacteria bacterium]